MILEISNVSCVKKTSIKLDGITVVAGKNGEGKSTIAKALSALISSNNKMDGDIRYQREQSVSRWLEDFNFSLVMARAEIRSPHVEEFWPFKSGRREFVSRVLELYEEGRLTPESIKALFSEVFSVNKENLDIDEDKFSSLKTSLDTPKYDLEKYTVFRAFREEFNNQVNSFSCADTAKVSITLDGDENSTVELNDNKVVSFVPFETKSAKRLSSVFLESPSRFDFHDEGRRSINTSLTGLLKKDVPGDEIYEDFKKSEDSLERVDSYIQEIIHGRFVKDNEGRALVFKDDSIENVALNLSNVASGVKVFAVIRRLVENRSLTENTVLIIDEPETGLHPEWQIKFAHLLGLISREIGVKMLLTTHSPYFLRAVEVMAENTAYVDNVRYYIMSDFSALDVTRKTEVIYKELYKPLEEL